jgi:hypothetical protein
MRKVRADAGLYNAALRGMDDLGVALKKYVQNPTDVNTRNNVGSRVIATATALNAAFGQGAMSEPERRGIEEALGASLASKEGVAAALMSIFGEGDEKAAKLLLSRLAAVRDTTRNTAVEKFKAYNLAFQPGRGASGKSEGGTVTLVDDSGTEFDVDAAKVDAILKAKPNLKRKDG